MVPGLLQPGLLWKMFWMTRFVLQLMKKKLQIFLLPPRSYRRQLHVLTEILNDRTFKIESHPGSAQEVPEETTKNLEDIGLSREGEYRDHTAAGVGAGLGGFAAVVDDAQSCGHQGGGVGQALEGMTEEAVNGEEADLKAITETNFGKVEEEVKALLLMLEKQEPQIELI